jgi:hypothetical protein
MAMEPDPNTTGHGTPRCGAATRSGGRCKLAAGQGTDHPGYGSCKYHLGATANGRKHAQELAALDIRDEALATLEASGYQPVTDPVTALQDVAGRQHLVTLAVQQTLTQAAQRDGLETVAGQPIAQWLQKAMGDESRTLSKMVEIGLVEQQRARLTADAAQLVEWLTTAFQAGQANPDADPHQAITDMIGDPHDP